MTSAIATYARISRNMPAELARVAGQSKVADATMTFASAVARTATLDEFLEDPAIYTYAKKAFGLDGAASSMGVIRRVLAEGTDAPTDLAFRMMDSRYLSLASAFAFDGSGTARYGASATTAAVATRYYREVLEDSVGKVSEAARMALYFERHADEIDGPWSIMADQTFLEVVRTALTGSTAPSAVSLQSQAAWIERKMNVADLKDENFRNRFLQRFIARYELQQAGSVSAPTVSFLSSASA